MIKIIISSGQISIIDLDDTKQLMSYIGSSQSKVVVYNPDEDVYMPNYGTSNQILTPQLFIAGESNDIISQASSVIWYKQNNGTGSLILIDSNDSDYILSGSSLIIESNVLKNYDTMHYICEIIYHDAESGLNIPIKSDIEIIKVSNGRKGEVGLNAITAILSNDSHTVPTDANGNNGNYVGAETTMIIYNGSTDDSSNWSVSVKNESNVIGHLVNKKYVITELTDDVGYVDLIATRQGYSSVERRFTLSKNKRGLDSTINWLVIDAHIIQRNTDGELLPETVNITAKSQTGIGNTDDYLGRFQIWERVNGSWGFPLYTSTSDESSVQYTPSNNIRAIRVALYKSGGTEYVLDEEILPVVSDGERGMDSLTAILSNDISTIGTDEFGDNGDFSSASTTMSILEGLSDVTSHWTFSATASNGVIGSLTGNVYSVSNMTVDSGYVDIVASRSGYTSMTRRFSISKSKAGSGENAVSYWLISNASVIKRKDDNLTPEYISLEGKSQTGRSSPTPYEGRFVISESVDGMSYTTKYTSTSKESEKTYTPSNSASIVRVQFYLAGGTTNLLDERIIPIVEDGSKGADGENAVVANIWTPDGNTLKNSEGLLKATMNLYDGSDDATPSLYKWYRQDPTATASNGGDSDGGNGWRLLNTSNSEGVTGFTTKTITIPSTAIKSIATFKCIVVYHNKRYQDTVTVIDVTDPIVVSIIGSTTFKNGQGDSQLFARILRNGEEIDESGTMYDYNWYLYFSDGTASIDFGVKKGKMITVESSDFIGRANLVCEVRDN